MKNKIVFSLAIMLGIILINHSCYAAVEIVPSKTGNGKDAIVNTTVSNSYLLCQGMKDFGGSLYGTTVKPHLATNKDWGAVSYLSNSIYGTNTQGGNTGVTVNINGVNYYSTTTNITGVMNWGSNPNIARYTQTAGLTSNSNGDSNVEELYNNRETNYVEYINPQNSANTRGMAMHEISGLDGADFYPGPHQGVSTRKGLFTSILGNNLPWELSQRSSGAANANNTFRPVVWN